MPLDLSLFLEPDLEPCLLCLTGSKSDKVIRISAKPEGQGPRSLIWNHAKCYLETSSAFQPEKLPGWDSLSDSDRATLLSLVKKNTSTSKGTKAEPEEQSTSKGNAKRKNAHESDQNSKIAIPGGDASSSKVKGQSAVHEQSELQDSGHILEDGNSIYNTTLNMSDLSTGVNSYYILQIIQDDKSSNCYVFCKWGRVGSEKIGGHNLDEMSKSDAIQKFKRLFLVKTGNTWEAWERKKDFQKKPGRFYPLDIDYGVKDPSMKKQLDFTSSKLAPQLVELMKMLFNVETYRAAMMQFEINLSEMPLGKLSKNNIQKGFEALTKIQDLLNNTVHPPAVKESLIVKMLEALQDIEIASKLVGFDSNSNESIDEKYEKLRCHVSPLSHDSEDFRLIEKYLHNTHAPTHTEWALDLEEVFSLEREGEMYKYAPYRSKLKNKMLLWHGEITINQLCWYLSQGLRIAPPEAPATGYMFGKGIYFADLVSKSAQYCFTDRNNPMGLMILSEVALGEYMDKLPKGKDSTKGLGKKKPLESEYAKWKDEVIVPCRKPVDSKVKASELMYNEYIVYDTAQY
ncbi:hypothetical protein ACS0TY_034369 [Phlomoides rotata]